MTDVLTSLPHDPELTARIEGELTRVRAGKEPIADHFAAAEAAVRSWQWSTDLDANLIPLERELGGGAPKAKSLPAAPESPKNVFALGHDDAGRLVYYRHYDFAGRMSVGCVVRRGTELRFWQARRAAPSSQADVRAEGAVFDVRPDVRLALRIGTDEPTYAATAYTLHEGRVTHVVQWSSSWPPGTVVVYDAAYDEHGRLASLSHGGQPVWKRVEKPLATLLKQLEESLLRELPAHIAAATSGSSEPLYCVALGYRELADELAPPSVGLGFEANREAARHALRGGGTFDVSQLWNPIQFEDGPVPGVFPVEGYGPELLALGKDVELRVLAEGATAKYRKALDGVAKRLSELDWSAVAKTTTDFVVYVTDYDQGDWAASLKKRVDAATWKKWKGEGIV